MIHERFRDLVRETLLDLAAAREEIGVLKRQLEVQAADAFVERGLRLVLSEDAKKWLVKKGSNLDFGARPLRRAIENYVEDPLSEELLKGEFQGKDTIVVDVKEVGGKKQLFFNGIIGEPEEAPVGAGAAPAEPGTP